MDFDPLILCNRTHPIPREYEVVLCTLPDGLQIDERMRPAYESLIAAIREAGFPDLLLDGYRTWETQEEVMRHFVEQHMNDGHSREEAETLAQQRVAVPGTSEHQLGLAVDIEPAEPDDDRLFAWLAENAHRFGFILRYPEEKTRITRIMYEPWHYRYVGLKAASEIHDRRCCLEEYLNELD